MIIEEIPNRRSVREYKKEEIPEDHLIEIIKAGQFAPTSRNNRATEFVIIKNPATRQKLFEIVGQEFVKEAPVLIIPITDTSKTHAPVQDISLASQNIFLQATSLDLGSVWKNVGDVSLEKKIKELINIPEDFRVINIIPIGYPKETKNPYEDKDFDSKKIHMETW